MQRNPRWEVPVSTGWPCRRPAGSGGGSRGCTGTSPLSSPGGDRGPVARVDAVAAVAAAGGRRCAAALGSVGVGLVPVAGPLQMLPIVSYRLWPLAGNRPRGRFRRTRPGPGSGRGTRPARCGHLSPRGSARPQATWTTGWSGFFLIELAGPGVAPVGPGHVGHQLKWSPRPTGWSGARNTVEAGTSSSGSALGRQSGRPPARPR